ncbi:class II glutamine amidotransferase [Bacteroidia bacterium]|nr:class II glutamine amidotransferase [Bacteroidia bacterium]MDB9882200.1 class II glutamine amidotransferase [Bacteroidia bacterium]
MSDPIKHECGVALIRLRKPLEYYREKYGTELYGLKKLQMLMNKQLNRGQDGAGLAVIKLDPQFGHRYIARQRAKGTGAVSTLFERINKKYAGLDEKKVTDTDWLKKNFAYGGELLLGHLRYATHGKSSVENIHPFLRQNNWMSRNLVLAGNYNVTNVKEMYQQLIDLGQHPKEISDNVTMLEKIGHFLDEENARLYQECKDADMDSLSIAAHIKNNLNLENVLKSAFKSVDGGYNMVGLIGDGNAFVMRDPNGIRPNYYWSNDEFLVVASERPAIQTAFDLQMEDLKEVTPGAALVIDRDGNFEEKQILPQMERLSCSFERIYFSRGSDGKIHEERKRLGRRISREILTRLDYDIRSTVFSYIPNTAATSYYGMIDGIYKYLDKWKRESILKLGANPGPGEIDKLLAVKIRREKLLVKDAKIRTFIAQDEGRDDLIGNGYDVTYGVVKATDTLVVVDDSIVRGNTLKKSILRILDRLGPKKIIVASSAPIIKYPDCYGIDMSRMNEFIAFQAVKSLLEKQGDLKFLDEVHEACKEELLKPISEMENKVKMLYDRFTDKEIEQEIGLLVTPDDMVADVEIVYQTIKGLNKACPNHLGDWYFSGNYPTPGGNQVVNRSFVYYMEGSSARAY